MTIKRVFRLRKQGGGAESAPPSTIRVKIFGTMVLTWSAFDANNPVDRAPILIIYVIINLNGSIFLQQNLQKLLFSLQNY